MNKLSLRQWRELQGWSQDFLANRISKQLNNPIGQDYISRLEGGQHPRYDIGNALQKMAKHQLVFGE